MPHRCSSPLPPPRSLQLRWGPGAAAPVEVVDAVMEEDEEYGPTDEEIEKEEQEEPLMMQNAQAWDNFVDLVAETARPWPQGADDTDTYTGRAGR